MDKSIRVNIKWTKANNKTRKKEKKKKGITTQSVEGTHITIGRECIYVFGANYKMVNYGKNSKPT